MNGAFTGGAQANFHLCGTAVVMGDGWAGASCPVPTTPTPISVEPADNSCYGQVNLGGGGFMEWTAPNLTSSVATQTDWNALEDLTLWTETSGTTNTSNANKIGGGGQMYISGVFFLPNANPFIISGGGLQNNGANAQFIARRLEANGNGTALHEAERQRQHHGPGGAVDLARPLSSAAKTRSWSVDPDSALGTAPGTGRSCPCDTRR